MQENKRIGQVQALALLGLGYKAARRRQCLQLGSIPTKTPFLYWIPSGFFNTFGGHKASMFSLKYHPMLLQLIASYTVSCTAYMLLLFFLIMKRSNYKPRFIVGEIETQKDLSKFLTITKVRGTKICLYSFCCFGTLLFSCLKGQIERRVANKNLELWLCHRLASDVACTLEW
jgi:hypothetical protein